MPRNTVIMHRTALGPQDTARLRWIGLPVIGIVATHHVARVCGVTWPFAPPPDAGLSQAALVSGALTLAAFTGCAVVLWCAVLVAEVVRHRRRRRRGLPNLLLIAGPFLAAAPLPELYGFLSDPSPVGTKLVLFGPWVFLGFIGVMLVLVANLGLVALIAPSLSARITGNTDT